jgi:outer membrane protein assembly factor BamE
MGLGSRVKRLDQNLKLPLQCLDHIGPTSTMTAPLKFCVPRAWLAWLVLGASLAGCGGIHRDTFRPYVPEVVQGNFVSKEQRQALRPGMVRAQVRDILGTPLVASLFHADRWDYAFSIQRQGVPAQNYRLTVLFKGDVLDQIESDILPSEAEFAGRIVTPRQTGKTPKLEATEEDFKKFPVNKPNADAPRPVPAPLPASYPPLEPAAR